MLLSLADKFATPFEKKCCQKFYLSARKCDGCSVICAPKLEFVGSGKWVKNHHFCAQLSHGFSQYRLEQFSTPVSVASGYHLLSHEAEMSDV